MGGKKSIKLLALVLVLGLCIGIYIWLDNYKAKENKSEEVDTSKVLIDTTGDNIVEIAYTQKDKTINLKYNSKKDKWYNAEHKSWPINQENVDSMLNVLLQITANRTIDTKEDLKEYGLDKPELVIEYKTKAKKSYKVNVGRSTTSYGCYVMVEGDKGIYTMESDLKPSFEYSEVDMVEVETIPKISSNLVYYVEAKGDDFNMKAEYDGDITQVDSGEWVLTKPYKNKVRGMVSAFTEYCVNLETFIFNKCVAYAPKDLGKYGLDKPKLSLKLKFKVEKNSDKDSEDEKVKYGNDELTLLIGDKIVEKIDSGDGELTDTATGYYAMVEGGKRVYSIDVSIADSLLEGRAFDFVYNAIHNVELIEYTDLKVKIDDKKYTLKKTRKHDNQGATKVVYTFNGTKCDESKGDEMYSAMSELVLAKEIGKKKIKKDKTIATFEYNGKKGGAKDTTIKFLNYDDDYYRVNVDGDEYFLTSKVEVDKFLKDIESFEKKVKK